MQLEGRVVSAERQAAEAARLCEIQAQRTAGEVSVYGLSEVTAGEVSVYGLSEVTAGEVSVYGMSEVTAVEVSLAHCAWVI